MRRLLLCRGWVLVSLLGLAACTQGSSPAGTGGAGGGHGGAGGGHGGAGGGHAGAGGSNNGTGAAGGALGGGGAGGRASGGAGGQIGGTAGGGTPGQGGGGSGPGGQSGAPGQGGGAGHGASGGTAGKAASGGAGNAGGSTGTGGVGGASPATDCDSVCDTGETCVQGICHGTQSRWTTVGGDVHHSGFNVNEAGTPPLTLAWQVALAHSGGLWPVVADGARVYVTENAYFDSMTRMWALDPATGTTLWKYDFGDIFNLGQPTVDRGHVYAAQVNNTPGTFMQSFVASTGTLFWSLPMSAQWENYWAPLITPQGYLYADGGEYGGLYGMKVADGTQLFFTGLEQWDSWSPMYLGGQLYTFIAGKLRVHDLLTNAILQTVTVQNPWNGTPYSMKAAPVSDGERIYLVAPPALLAFRPGDTAPVWSSSAAYTGMPAVANGVVYAISAGQLRASDATSGNLLWTFAGDNGLTFPPVVAGKFVYVSSAAKAYAFDTSTQQIAWMASPGGWLSIAGGRVYVAQADGKLSAYALTAGSP